MDTLWFGLRAPICWRMCRISVAPLASSVAAFTKEESIRGWRTIRVPSGFTGSLFHRSCWLPQSTVPTGSRPHGLSAAHGTRSRRPTNEATKGKGAFPTTPFAERSHVRTAASRFKSRGFIGEKAIGQTGAAFWLTKAKQRPGLPFGPFGWQCSPMAGAT